MVRTAITPVFVAVVLVVSSAGCSDDEPSGTSTDSDAAEAALLVIDLQDGFAGARVELVVNGRTVARLDEVMTDELLGLAESVTVEVPVGPTEVRVRIDDVELVENLEVDADRFLGVSRTADGPRIIVSAEPFGYG
ncbi:MAG: hypothetical protein AAFZ07_20005 [Actinomycetota bacterium]